MNPKNLLVVFFILFISVSGFSGESAVENFGNIVSVKFFTAYNFMVYAQDSLDYTLYSNRPLDLGTGIGVLNVSVDISISIPFIYDYNHKRSRSFELNIHHYTKNNNYTYGYFEYYEGFNNRSKQNFELSILNAGLIYTYVFNKNHSIRSAYNLDRRQTVSNGSFLLGGGLFFRSMISPDPLLNQYSSRTNYYYLGPSVGYSHTFIISNNFFLNTYTTLGVNLLTFRVQDDWTASLDLQPVQKFSIGYHRKRWSANFFFDILYSSNRFSSVTEYDLISGSAGLVLVFRF